jgi:hypothetical protein
MSWMEAVADRKIKEAQDEGLFDNLPGKGKPLNLDEDSRVPPEQRLANKLLKEANVLPDWIELDKEVRQTQVQWERRIDAFGRRWEEDRRRRIATFRLGEDDLPDRNRDHFLLEVAIGLRALNDRIDRLNLIVPTLAQQRPRISLRERMRELEERLPRLRPYPEGETPSWERIAGEKRGAINLSNHRVAARRGRRPIE